MSEPLLEKPKPVIVEDEEIQRERALELERTREAWIQRQVDGGMSREDAESILKQREKTKARRARDKEQDVELSF